MKKVAVYKVDKWNPDVEVIKLAAKKIREGCLVAFPTETVYGLGANALDEEAVRKIFLAKGRPQDNPLIVHVASLEAAQKIAYCSQRALNLMKAFWPGPLTLVMKSKEIVPKITSGGLDTVAIRMPSHPVALALIEKSGIPIAAPSANTSGRPSPTNAEAVYDDLGDKIDVILDSGPTDVGVESTVIDVTGERVVLLRPGGLPVEALESFGERVILPEGLNRNERTDEKRRSPGTRYRHYAPSCKVLLWKEGEDWPELEVKKIGYLGIRKPPSSVGDDVILFESLEHYARGLFMALRYLEKRGVEVIVADYPKKEGLGLAIRDRLYRASLG
ncbi:L-threonylcarbamoyladenylate synthase [Acetomicrobium sp.]|uniref:L-threonylcarbamoyladenylate synthase n=1 Tax=Acetomicrobium sp. TaxID=1872099 RepID=UPI002871DFCB|nr:L-threonylcarbamoyladenylate synthase [Acetomicrobium sp.]MDR9770345.1 L-threonylcarbamoyladenylate synthase [Acetomicrobium sp.]HXK98833.1 L-threonylcarbamoyladenylate synthase [Acetomicrobium sp.]